MALLNLYTNDLAGHQLELKDQTKQSLTSLLNTIKAVRIGGHSRIWNNPKLTPQQALDAYGTEAAMLLSAAAATDAFILQFDPNYVAPVLPPHTVNQDGTITVTT